MEISAGIFFFFGNYDTNECISEINYFTRAVFCSPFILCSNIEECLLSFDQTRGMFSLGFECLSLPLPKILVSLQKLPAFPVNHIETDDEHLVIFVFYRMSQNHMLQTLRDI